MDAMALYDLLLALCFVIPIAAAVTSARMSKAGFGAYLLVIPVGLALGWCCARTMHTVGARIAVRIRRRPESLQERYFRLLYLAFVLWIVIALVLGTWVPSLLLRLVFVKA